MKIYGVIGNNWGKKIYNILSKYKRNVFFLKTNSNFKDQNTYFNYLSNQIKTKNIKIIWLAINPRKIFNILNFLVKKKIVIVIEKPWLLENKKVKIISKKILINNVKIFFHFEYLFLNKLKKINKKNINHVILKFCTANKKKRIPAKYEIGSHLAAIKIHYFKKIKNYKYVCYYSNNNVRSIEIFYKNSTQEINFTNNKENIILKFIKYIELVLKNKKRNFLDLNFAQQVKKEIINNF